MATRIKSDRILMPSSTSDPASAAEGDMYYNSATDKLKFYNGSQWVVVGNLMPEFVSPSADTVLATIYDSVRSSYSITSITATDPDSDPLTWSISTGSLPSGMSINSSTGAITGTPNAVASDTTSTFTVKIDDGLGGVATRQFKITVKAPAVASYTATDTIHTWTKPAGVSSVNAVLWGGGGGGGNPNGGPGGGGGYTYGTLNVSNVSSLQIIVGEYGNGENNHFNTGNGNGCGGGLSGIFTSVSTSSRDTTWNNSILIAGGGGGGGELSGSQAGTGGGSSGASGSGGSGGSGGTQTSGGTIPQTGNGSCTGNCAGEKLRGGNGCGGAQFDSGSSYPSNLWGTTWSAGAGGNGCNAGGGGGGYYGGGGGGGSPNGGPAGGGSGYIGGHSSVSVSSAATSNNGQSINPAGQSHQYYSSNVGVGGATEQRGNTGKVVIWY